MKKYQHVIAAVVVLFLLWLFLRSRKPKEVVDVKLFSPEFGEIPSRPSVSIVAPSCGGEWRYGHDGAVYVPNVCGVEMYGRKF